MGLTVLFFQQVGQNTINKEIDMNNVITNTMSVNEYTPFTIISTNTDLVQISGVVPKEDIEKLNNKKIKPSTKQIKIKKKKTTN